MSSREPAPRSAAFRGRLFLALLLGIPSLVLFIVSISRSVVHIGLFDPVLSALCHRQSDRCLWLPWGTTALCSRCTFFWLGLAAGTLLVYRRVIRAPFWTGLPALMPLIADGLLQLHTSYESSNGIRILTGLAAGLGVSIIFLAGSGREWNG